MGRPRELKQQQANARLGADGATLKDLVGGYNVGVTTIRDRQVGIGGRVLRTFTLDTNCLIDIDENRPAAREIRALADAHAAGAAEVAVIAISASENPRPGQSIRDFSEFKSRLVTLGLAHLKIVMPMMYWDVSFWNHGLWADDAMVDLERQLHSILFPNEEFTWEDYCRANSACPPPNSPSGKWRNHKCDVQAIWSHIHAGREVFVTTDGNFHKRKSDLIALGADQIKCPIDAAKLL
jgi:hypothetical protein